MAFRNRKEAGRHLADALRSFASEQPIVLALPRGGVPVAFEVARELRAPLDVLVVRKLGVPGLPELAMGALAEGGAIYLDAARMRRLKIRPDDLEEIAEREDAELARRAARFRGGRPLPRVAGRTVILVDDGIATGATARAGIRAIRQRDAARVVVATPVIAARTAELLNAEVDDLVYLQAPPEFAAVGDWYDDFKQTTDAEVVALLEAARAREYAVPSWVPERGGPQEVNIPLTRHALAGTLDVPAEPRGVIVFAHGSGSGRASPRNQQVARALREAGFATLLVDLLTEAEQREDERTHRLRFDIPFLAQRLLVATQWAALHPAITGLRVGYFGASTGAAAALAAAALAPHVISAVVSRGGRPDLAGPEHLAEVRAAVLLIVGAEDRTTRRLNEQALSLLQNAELVEVPGATHLFEEPGALEVVGQLAAQWFDRTLVDGEHAAAV